MEVLRGEPIAGAIVVPTSDRKPVLRPLQERGIPVVTIDRRSVDGSADTVLIDNVAAAREAVAHLIANGYHRIGLITGPEGTTTARERRDGYRLALHDAGITVDPWLERSGPYSEESARHWTSELLDLVPRIDAIFTGNNRLTMGALQAFHGRELRVPDDIGLAGFDEVPWAHPGAVSLTCVIQPAYELGCTAAERLIQRVRRTGSTARQDIVLAHHLQIGDSSRPRSFAGAPLTG